MNFQSRFVGTIFFRVFPIFCIQIALGTAEAMRDTLSPEIIAPNSYDSSGLDASSLTAAHPRRAIGRVDTAGILNLDKLIVAAGKIRELTPSKATLDAKIFSGRYVDLQSVLETVSGITISNRGGFGHYADASIRGSSPSQVNVYLDGIPLNGANGGAVDISKIPFPLLQTITIYKAASGIEFFGENAGGVISLSTDASKDATTASMEVGTFGYRIGSAMICKTVGPMVHRLSVSYGWADNNYPYTDSIVTRGPTVTNDDSVKIMDNNFFSTFSSMYSNTFTLNNHAKLTSQFSAIVDNEGIFYLPEAGFNDGNIRDSKMAIVESYATSIDSNIRMTLTAKGKMENRHFRRFQPFYLSPPGGGAVLHDITQPFGSLESVIKGDPSDHFLITGILSASYDGFNFSNLLTPPGQTQPRYSRIAGKAGMEADIHMSNKFSARVGGIYKYEKDSLNDSITLFGSYVPRGKSAKEGFPGGFSELRYQLFDCLGLIASIHYGSRSPGFSEKFSEGAYFSGNPGLRPETRLEYNAGFSFLKPYLALSSAFFASTTKDKIIYTMTSHMFVPKNISDVQGWGLESDVTLTPFSRLSIVNSFTYMENIVHSTTYPSWNGNDEPLQPRFSDNVNLTVAYKNIYASHSARFNDRYFTDYDNTVMVPQSKPQMNATIGCDVGEHFDFSYRIENYLNIQDYDFQRPLPGTTQYVVLKYQW